MTSTLTERDKAAGNGHGDRGALVTRGRAPRLPRALLGVLLIVGSALVFAVLEMNVGHRRPVLAVARTVHAGDVIRAADIRVVRVSADPDLRPLPAVERAAVLGQVAAVDLVPGTLLVPGEFGGGVSLAPGEAIVGVALKPGQSPGRLRAGDRVMVVRTGTPGVTSATGEGDVLVPSATVVLVEPVADAAASEVVSLRLDAPDAARVTDAAAAGRVSLVQVGA